MLVKTKFWSQRFLVKKNFDKKFFGLFALICPICLRPRFPLGQFTEKQIIEQGRAQGSSLLSQTGPFLSIPPALFLKKGCR